MYIIKERMSFSLFFLSVILILFYLFLRFSFSGEIFGGEKTVAVISETGLILDKIWKFHACRFREKSWILKVRIKSFTPLSAETKFRSFTIIYKMEDSQAT